MIKYELVCDSDHIFESWFRDSAAYDRMATQGALTCPECGSVRVGKALMAPRLARRKGHDDRREAAVQQAMTAAVAPVAAALPAAGTEGAAQAPATLMQALRVVRSFVEKNFDYVGDSFAAEARKIHYGESEARAIYGEASAEERAELREEGVEVIALPLPREDA